jgi:hypothetical protein
MGNNESSSHLSDDPYTGSKGNHMITENKILVLTTPTFTGPITSKYLDFDLLTSQKIEINNHDSRSKNSHQISEETNFSNYASENDLKSHTPLRQLDGMNGSRESEDNFLKKDSESDKPEVELILVFS